MKWSAWHHDGFTDRLLNYDLQGEDDIAELEASWFSLNNTRTGPKRRWRSIFSIDDAPLRAALPQLRLLNKSYDCGMDDVGSQSLTVEIHGEKLECTVNGGGLLLKKHPELEPLLEVLWRLHDQVLAHIKENYEG